MRIAPSASGGGIVAQILQTLGTLLFRVERNGPPPTREFRVRTPYHTATVKGTVFAITAGTIFCPG